MPKAATPKKPATKKTKPQAEPKRVLVLRTCGADLTSHNGFQWPESGEAVCPDWKPKAECGNGLHGLLWGVGSGGLLDWSETAKWLVVSVEESTIVDLVDKVKFPKGEVVHVGDRLSATAYLAANGGHGYAIVGGTATAGHRGTATAGDGGTIAVKWWDTVASRYRLAVGYIGEDGLEPNTSYRFTDGKWIKTT